MPLLAGAFLFVSCANNEKKTESTEGNEMEMSQGNEEKIVPQDVTAKADADKNRQAFAKTYLEFQSALAKGDEAKSITLATQLAPLAPANLSTALTQAAKNQAGAGAIDSLRTLLPALTVSMEEAVKMGDIEVGTYYKQYCPMAFNDKGASWFSAAPEIRNPYFADAMLECGEVKEAFAVKK